MKKALITLLTLSALISTQANAQNRGADDEIFSEPKKAGWTQIFLGFAELIAAEYAYPGLSSEAKAVKTAELRLAAANDLPLSEVQRESSIKAIINNPSNYKFESDLGDESQLKSHHANRIEKLRSASIVSQADKAKAIESASENVAKARESALRAAQKSGIVSKTVKVVRVGASVLLVGDVVARIYVWNAMEANPTLSPAATYIYDQLIAE